MIIHIVTINQMAMYCLSSRWTMRSYVNNTYSVWVLCVTDWVTGYPGNKMMGVFSAAFSSAIHNVQLLYGNSTSVTRVAISGQVFPGDDTYHL